jgi:demethylmenaquinone methyltransferase / 2-methoxy-6-polyprenyl-1,4-benzoquinol methylase
MADARPLFAPLPARYDRLAEVLSFYQNSRWRSAMVSRVPTTSGVIADVAAGTAGVSLRLASRFSDARVLGVDLSLPMLREGQARVQSAGAAARVGLVCGRGERLPLAAASVDALTFTYLLRYVPSPEATLAELARVVKPGGVMASLEFAVPSWPVWFPSWFMYTRLVLPVFGLLSGGVPWWRVGRFLGPSISSHYQRYPISWTVSAWRSAGFTDVGYRRMSLGGGLVMWGTRVG